MRHPPNCTVCKHFDSVNGTKWIPPKKDVRRKAILSCTRFDYDFDGKLRIFRCAIDILFWERMYFCAPDRLINRYVNLFATSKIANVQQNLEIVMESFYNEEIYNLVQWDRKLVQHFSNSLFNDGRISGNTHSDDVSSSDIVTCTCACNSSVLSTNFVKSVPRKINILVVINVVLRHLCADFIPSFCNYANNFHHTFVSFFLRSFPLNCGTFTSCSVNSVFKISNKSTIYSFHRVRHLCADFIPSFCNYANNFHHTFVSFFLRGFPLNCGTITSCSVNSAFKISNKSTIYSFHLQIFRFSFICHSGYCNYANVLLNGFVKPFLLQNFLNSFLNIGSVCSCYVGFRLNSSYKSSSFRCDLRTFTFSSLCYSSHFKYANASLCAFSYLISLCCSHNSSCNVQVVCNPYSSSCSNIFTFALRTVRSVLHFVLLLLPFVFFHVADEMQNWVFHPP